MARQDIASNDFWKNPQRAAYYNQWKDIGMQHLVAGDLRPGGEFNSKFTKSDCLEGELTVVIYYGKKKWDGARRLKDFLPEALRRDRLQDLIADYPVNLVDVRNFPDADKFQTDLRQVFHFMQKDNDKEQPKQYVTDSGAFFDNISEDAYDLLAAMSNIQFLRQRKKRYLEKKKGTCKMCKAMDDWGKDERRKGRREGRRQGIRQIRYDSARKMYRKGYPAEEIADIVGEKLATVTKWCDKFASLQ